MQDIRNEDIANEILSFNLFAYNHYGCCGTAKVFWG